MSEQVLPGGNLGRVVRIGDTVRRPPGPWTPAVHALLRHLERVGFDAAPRVLGIDEHGREMLTYVSGDVVGEHPWPAWVWTDALLAQVGQWLRRYHLAVADFREPAGARWRMCWAPQQRDEVICHFDVAPYNLVRRAAGDIAMIDWDVAAPGQPIDELARVAYVFLPIYDVRTREALGHVPGTLNEAMLARSAARITVLLDAYGLEDRTGFVVRMIAACERSHARIRRGAADGDAAIAALLASGIADHVLDTAALLRIHADALQRAIEVVRR